MKITNDFLLKANAGLTQGDTWITRNMELRKKDWYPLRILKSWTKSIFSYCHLSSCVSSIYSDIRADSILEKLQYADWAGVDPEKAKIFLELFARATKRNPSANTFSVVRTDIPSITRAIEGKIIGDTFVQNWLQKEGWSEILMNLSTREVDITLGDQVFSVVRDKYSSEVYVRMGGKGVACVTVYLNNEMTAVISDFGCQFLDADKLETILLTAHDRLRNRC